MNFTFENDDLRSKVAHGNPYIFFLFRFLRFNDPELNSLFDTETGAFIDKSNCLPRLHMALMRIWETWLDKFPEDFRENSLLQVGASYVTNL